LTDPAPAEEIRNSLRDLPSVDSLLRLPDTLKLLQYYGHSLTTEALRIVLAEQRAAFGTGQTFVSIPTVLVQLAREWLEEFLAPSLRPVINGTGIIIHTNLGRAPLSAAAQAAIQAVGGNYSTLEYELLAGRRGSRTEHAEALLTRLTGADAALTVNNNAAAVLLVLTALCQGKEVIISRGQLVEIGGGFRIPDVMVQSGARLVEVGTTNRTHLGDYETAIGEQTAAILVAHHSNYKIIGFAEEPSLSDLADLAHQHHLPLLFDQGSGAMLDVSQFGLEPEPTVLDGLQAGCDIVAFSGDKLLGGPQAGILCGRAELIDKLKRHPLARAVRADKSCLSALAATLTPYLTGTALSEVPVWRMIARPLAEIAADADSWAAQLRAAGIRAQTIGGRSMVGGGSLPGTDLPTRLVAIEQSRVDTLASSLRNNTPPLIGRIQEDCFLIDPRTVLPGQGETIVRALLAHASREVA
jgi:L-seryl-tRNA(Ser) seleniumtransferase